MIKKILALCFMVFQLQATNIFQAVEVNDKLAVRQWLKSKPSVELLNEQGQSLLHVAVQAGNRILVKDLLKKKIDVNLIDQFGKTAMDYAVELQYKDIVSVLLKHKASVTTEAHMSYIKKLLCKKQRLYKILGWVFVVPSILFVISIGTMAAFTNLVPYISLPVFLMMYVGISLLGPCYSNIPSAGFFLASRKYQKLIDENILII